MLIEKNKWEKAYKILQIVLHTYKDFNKYLLLLLIKT